MTEACKLYAGADLHGKNVVLAICDQTGNTVFRKRVRANLEAVNEALHPYWDRIEQLAVESTFNWYWFVDGLREQGHDVRLANPARMEQYDGLKVTNDHSDASWLAEQVRLGILPEAYIYPKDTRPIRDVLRRRQLFMRQRTQSLLSLEGLLARHGLPMPSVRALKSWTIDDISRTGLGKFNRIEAITLLDSLRKSDVLAQRIEEQVLDEIKPTKDFERIQQLPGIGKILGMTILLESGEFERFSNAGHYASYCRTVKSVRTSDGKKKGCNNAKNGNKYLAWAFIEAATFAVRHYPRIRAWHDRKKNRRNIAVARKALACKLAKATWHVMRGADYDEKLLFG